MTLRRTLVKKKEKKREREKREKKNDVVERMQRVSNGAAERKKALQSDYRRAYIGRSPMQPLPTRSGSNRFHLFRVPRAARSRFDNETSYKRKCKPEWETRTRCSASLRASMTIYCRGSCPEYETVAILSLPPMFINQKIIRASLYLLFEGQRAPSDFFFSIVNYRRKVYCDN